MTIEKQVFDLDPERKCALLGVYLSASWQGRKISGDGRCRSPFNGSGKRDRDAYPVVRVDRLTWFICSTSSIKARRVPRQRRGCSEDLTARLDETLGHFQTIYGRDPQPEEECTADQLTGIDVLLKRDTWRVNYNERPSGEPNAKKRRVPRPGQSSKFHNEVGGVYTHNRQGRQLCPDWQAGTCKVGPGVACSKNPELVHQCNKCLEDRHGGSRCNKTPHASSSGHKKRDVEKRRNSSDYLRWSLVFAVLRP